METEGSLSQQNVTGSYPKPDAPSPHPSPYFPKIHSDFILPHRPMSSKWSLPVKFSNQKYCMHFSSVPYVTRIMPVSS